MPKRIAFDVRKIRDYGIGTYVRRLLHRLLAECHPSAVRWILIGRTEDRELLPDQTNIEWDTLSRAAIRSF